MTNTSRPVLDIEIGDMVRSYDFPGIDDYYIEGPVVGIEDGHYKIRVDRVIREGVTLEATRNPTHVFPPVNGSVGFFGPTKGVRRI